MYEVESGRDRIASQARLISSDMPCDCDQRRIAVEGVEVARAEQFQAAAWYMAEISNLVPSSMYDRGASSSTRRIRNRPVMRGMLH